MDTYISIISSLFIFLFPYIGKRWFNRTLLASTVVSLGLLGTFGGIFIGLMGFDVTYIEMALPQLLNGLKTAFLTSIAGMCSSLIIKLCPIFYGLPTEEVKESESEAEQMLAILSNIDKNIQAANENTDKNMNMLNNTFSSFAEHLSTISANAINTALQKTIENWDTQISSQMNSVLKEISISVKNMENTQEINSEQIKSINDHIQDALKALNQTSESIEQIFNKSISLNTDQQKAVNLQMNNLGSLVKTTQEQFEQQINHMEEKIKQELSVMGQFSQTLITIINKLAQDHNTIAKRQQD